MMSLYTETNRLHSSSLSKHKTNLYFKEVIIVKKEASFKNPQKVFWLVILFIDVLMS